MSKITVDQTSINILINKDQDYICLTDMVSKHEEGSKLIEKWLSNKNTLEFLGVWESLYNPDFNSPEFGGIRSEAGTNRFFMSAKQWIEKTNAIGIMAKAGRYGGTYAHKDIAFEFGSYISPIFKLLLIKEFQVLKEQESKLKNSEWDYRRFLTKTNYKLHTDAIKDTIIPSHQHLTKEQEGYIYANEAEMLNVAVFGKTSKQWKQENSQLVLQGLGIRDAANIPQLTVLSNLENYNSILIKDGISGRDRLDKLKKAAIEQLQSLSRVAYNYPIESPLIKTIDTSLPEQKIELSSFNQSLKIALNNKPKDK